MAFAKAAFLSPAECEAVAGLVMLSQAAVIFPQSVSSEQDRDTDETETDKDLPARRRMNSAARALYSLQYDPRSGRNDVLSPPGTMIPNLASGKPWFHDLLTCKPLKDFVKFGLRAANLNGEAEERVAAVLDVMEDRSCWYLEECDWDVPAAVALYHDDEGMRERRKRARHRAANAIATQVTTSNYHPLMLNFQLRDANGVIRTVAQFVRPDAFNKHDAEHMKALNQWRNDLTRLLCGSPSATCTSTSTAFPPTQAKYTEAEDRFLLNRFGSKIPDFDVQTKSLAMQEITHDFNALFVGRCPPHALSPCGPRKVESIKEHIHTSLIGRKLGDPSYRLVALTIKAIQAREQAEFEALTMAGSIEHGMSGMDEIAGESGGGGSSNSSVKSDNDNASGVEFEDEIDYHTGMESDSDAAAVGQTLSELEIPEGQDEDSGADADDEMGDTSEASDGSEDGMDWETETETGSPHPGPSPCELY